MSYTVKQLANLSGVSIRTLHFYDEISLLKPAYCTESGYRYDEKEHLLMLQQILFFKELGFKLNEIQKVIDSNDFNKIEALKSHKETLLHRIEHMKTMINTIDKTILHLKGEITMKEKELYYGLNSEQQGIYEQYLIDSGKVSLDTINRNREKFKNWTQQDWDKWKAEGDQLHKNFVKALEDGLDPNSEVAQNLTSVHYALFSVSETKTKDGYIGLAELYCEHPDFKTFYKRYHQNLLEFMTKSMRIFAEKNLS